MRNPHPLIYSYHVVRLRNVTHLRSCVPVPRKQIFSDYSKIVALFHDSYEISSDLCFRVSGTLLGYSAYNKCYYPLANFDPDIKFNPIPNSISNVKL